MIKLEKYRPVQSASFWVLRVVAGTRSTSQTFRQPVKVREIEVGVEEDVRFSTRSWRID